MIAILVATSLVSSTIEGSASEVPGFRTTFEAVPDLVRAQVIGSYLTPLERVEEWLARSPKLLGTLVALGRFSNGSDAANDFFKYNRPELDAAGPTRYDAVIRDYIRCLSLSPSASTSLPPSDPDITSCSWPVPSTQLPTRQSICLKIWIKNILTSQCMRRLLPRSPLRLTAHTDNSLSITGLSM